MVNYKHLRSLTWYEKAWLRMWLWAIHKLPDKYFVHTKTVAHFGIEMLVNIVIIRSLLEMKEIGELISVMGDHGISENPTMESYFKDLIAKQEIFRKNGESGEG